MNFDKNIVDELLEQIFPIPKEFGAGSKIGENLFYHIKYKIKQFNDSIKVTKGMTKLVIILPAQYNYVIKIPFNGHYYLNEFEFFKNAINDIDASDYCLTEFLKYQQLKDQNLECFVAETLYYKTIDSTRIFIQEKVIPLDDIQYENIPTPSERSKEIVDYMCSCNDIEFYDIEWIGNCIDIYGKNKTEKFFQYCNEEDPDILEDFHDGNYGYRKNKEPVILDYSNYNG